MIVRLPVARGLAACLAAGALSLAVCAHAAETTLEIPPDTTVDLTAKQLEAERAAAARAAAAMPNIELRDRIVPEIVLLQRHVLKKLPLILIKAEAADLSWLLAERHVPELKVHRVIPLLIGAGFASVPTCPGEEWAGVHGKGRVRVRVEPKRGVILNLRLADESCATGR